MGVPCMMQCTDIFLAVIIAMKITRKHTSYGLDLSFSQTSPTFLYNCTEITKNVFEHPQLYFHVRAIPRNFNNNVRFRPKITEYIK